MSEGRDQKGRSARWLGDRRELHHISFEVCYRALNAVIVYGLSFDEVELVKL